MTTMRRSSSSTSWQVAVAVAVALVRSCLQKKQQKQQYQQHQEQQQQQQKTCPKPGGWHSAAPPQGLSFRGMRQQLVCCLHALAVRSLAFCSSEDTEGQDASDSSLLLATLLHLTSAAPAWAPSHLQQSSYRILSGSLVRRS